MARDTETQYYGQGEEVDLDDIDFMAPEEGRRSSESRSTGWIWMLAGAVVGMAAMYLLDPRSGSRRRVLLGGRVRDLSHKISHPMEFIGKASSSTVEDALTHH